MLSTRANPGAAVILSMAILFAGCLGGTPPAPKLSVTILSGGQVDAQPNWTVGWAVEVFQSVGENQTVTLSAEPPSGWTSRVIKSELNFTHGGEKHVTFVLVNIPDTQANGSYSVKFHASLGGERAEATATVVVSRPETNLLKNGTVVQMDYVGFLENSEVFDTSIWAVANSSIDKTPDFRNNSLPRTIADYKTFSLSLGARQVIQGWDLGLVGMGLNQHKALIVPPELAYGIFVEQNFSLMETMPIYNTTTADAFRASTGFEAQEDAEFADPDYGWTVRVVNVDNATKTVTVQNLPNTNATYTPYGVNATVKNISSMGGANGTFELHWTPVLNETTNNHLDDGVVTQINETAFTVKWQTNHRQPLAPKTLYFLVYARSTTG